MKKDRLRTKGIIILFAFFRIIRKLVSLISAQATLQAQTEAALRQASSASDAARRLMDGGSGGKDAKGQGANDKENSAKVARLETEVNTLKEGKIRT